MLSPEREKPEETAALPASIPKDWTAAAPTSTAGIHILDTTLPIRTCKVRYKLSYFKMTAVQALMYSVPQSVRPLRSMSFSILRICLQKPFQRGLSCGLVHLPRQGPEISDVLSSRL